MFFNRIIKISIYLLVFLLPLFFLPFSFEFLEFNKQYLLFFLVSLAFFAWLAKMVLVDKEVRFRKTPLDIFVLAFILIAILSAVFSIDRVSSLFGFYGRFSDGLIGLLSLGALYFLITNNVGIKSEIRISSLLKAFTWSVFFVILISYFSIFEIWSRIFYLFGVNQGEPFQFGLLQIMAQRGFNTVSGSLEGLAIFLAVAMTLFVGIILFQISDIKSQKYILKLKHFFYWILIIASLFLLLIIGFAAAWIVLLVSLAFFTGFILWKRMLGGNVNRLLLPILLVIISVIGLVINTAGITSELFGRDLLLRERVLEQGISWQVAAATATDNVGQGFLGSGVGTFFYNFSRHKPAEFNQDPFWHIRFDRSGNHFAEILGTMGFLGILSYLALIGLFLLISWIILISKKQEYNIDGFQFSLLIMFVALLVAQFVYYQNTVLAFMFWLALALSVVSWQKPIIEKRFSFAKFPELSLVFTVLLILVGLATAGTYFFAQRFYRADMAYAQSRRMFAGPERTALVEKAITLNPYFAQYYSTLARVHLETALTEMERPLEEQNVAAIELAVARAIDAARIGALRNPNQVASWQVLAMIYRDIILVAEGAKEWSIDSFERAIELEPTNPVLHTELGKLLALDDLDKAREKFIKALELKPNYFDASIQLARSYEEKNNLSEAINIMRYSVEKAQGVAVLVDTLNLVFELGRLYYNDGQIDQAIVQFERVVEVFPHHADALYSLGISFQEKGENSKAIGFFERVLELNPGHQEVIARLKELRGLEE